MCPTTDMPQSLFYPSYFFLDWSIITMNRDHDPWVCILEHLTCHYWSHDQEQEYHTNWICRWGHAPQHSKSAFKRTCPLTTEPVFLNKCGTTPEMTLWSLHSVSSDHLIQNMHATSTELALLSMHHNITEPTVQNICMPLLLLLLSQFNHVQLCATNNLGHTCFKYWACVLENLCQISLVCKLGHASHH